MKCKTRIKCHTRDGVLTVSIYFAHSKMLLPYSLRWNTSQPNNLWSTVGFCCDWKMGVLLYIYSVAYALFCEALAVCWWKILPIYWTLNGKGLAMNIIPTWGSYWSCYPLTQQSHHQYGLSRQIYHLCQTRFMVDDQVLRCKWRLLSSHETFNSKDCVKWI
mgnify:CR=1 FL=1